MPVHYPPLHHHPGTQLIPLTLGLTKEDDQEHAYLQCGPRKPYTDGGTDLLLQEDRYE